MTESFLSYSEDFEQYHDDAARDINAIASAPTPAARDELSQSAQDNISEAERYLRILESESRAGDSQEQRKMRQQLRTFKSKIGKLKSSLDSSRLIADSQQRLNDRPANMSAQENMARYQQRMDRTDNHLTDAQTVLVETEAVAQNVQNNLAVQREHLVNVGANVNDTHTNANEAGTHLDSLKRKIFTQIALLYFVIFGLIVIIIYKAISKFS